MTTITRRRLIATAAAVAATAGSTIGAASAQDGAVPNSSGTERPRAKAPPNTCDAHFHIIDARFPPDATAKPAGMTFDDYRLLQARLGTTRAVPVQPKNHGTDPTCLLDALQRFDGNGRGIAVLHPDVTDAELKRLDAGYVRGLRFSVWNPNDAVASIDMIEPLAKRIADLGWHVQLHMSAAQIAENAALLNRLPCGIVFDHMGRLPPSKGPDDPAFKTIGGLVDRGRTWVKLAGAYLNTEVGPPGYPDATRVAKPVATGTCPASSARRASRRQPNNCCGVSPWRRATTETTAPGQSVSSKTAALASADQIRLPPAPLTSSSRLGSNLRSSPDTCRSSTPLSDGHQHLNPSCHPIGGTQTTLTPPEMMLRMSEKGRCGHWHRPWLGCCPDP
ncbi:amidohydrolase family protein [Methylobacterium amylolyticum]